MTIFMVLIDESKMAAAFSLKDLNGKTHRKTSRHGVRKESCDLRDNLPKFKQSTAAVLAPVGERA
jgi:peroxiredoxin